MSDTEKYVELYKKYRPRVWDDIIGQSAAVDSVRKSVLNLTIPTGYVFFGPAGCGKTSTAFILAKALNCENLQENGNPCNECATCKGIDNNAQFGLQYVSMANRGSVEDIRKLVGEAQLAQPIKHQVWILDDCHRLSPAAWDALLIPLESEKTKTLFIFCSTEPDKIPKTILSRVQTRTFNPVDMKTLATNLAKIVKEENLSVSKEDIISAVRSANGSVRQSIGNLETLLSNGSLPEEYGDKVLNLLASNKYTDVYALTTEMQSKGQNFTESASRLYRDLSQALVIKAGGTVPGAQPALKTTADLLSPNLIIKYLDVVGNTITLMSRNTVDSRILFDIALSKIVAIKRTSKEG